MLHPFKVVGYFLFLYFFLSDCCQRLVFFVCCQILVTYKDLFRCAIINLEHHLPCFTHMSLQTLTKPDLKKENERKT